MSRGNALVAFLGGMGTGYLAADKAKQDKERQDKLDKMAQETHDVQLAAAQRVEDAAAKTDAVNADVAAVPTETYGAKHGMSPDDVRSVMGGSANEGDATYISDEAAKHYAANVTGPSQVTSNAAYMAKNGISQGLAGMKAVKGADGVDIADPATATARAPWKIIEDKANVRINSGDPAQEQIGYQALAHSTTMKSKTMLEGLAAARAKGADGMLKFIGDWDNTDIPATNLRLEAPPGGSDPKNPEAGGVYNVYGTINGKEQIIRQYDTSKLPKGMTIDDAIYHDAASMADPSKMFDLARDAITAKRTDMQNDIANKRADKELNIKEKSEKDKAWYQKASIEVSKEGNAISRMSANHTIAKAAQDPESVRVANWYAAQSPAMQAAFDKLNVKEGQVKVTADALGGATITSGKDVFQLDRKGNLTQVQLPAAAGGITAKPGTPTAPPKDRPPLSSFGR